MLRLPPALNYRRFTLLWAGLIISVLGSQMQQWVLFWQVSQLSRAPIAGSILGRVRLVVVLALSLIGGLVADRYNRRTIMFLTQSVLALVALVLGLLTLTGVIQLWHIYLLTAVQAAASAFDLPARQALTPNLVAHEVLPSAFSLMSIAFSTGAILGPALSGLVIGYWGTAWAYILNAVSFPAVIVALILMGSVPQRPSEARGGLKAALADIRVGVSFIRHQPLI